MTMQPTLEAVEQMDSSEKIVDSAPPYVGFFIRHFVGEVPTDPTDNEAGISQSPDIIVTGQNSASDPSVFTTRGTNPDNYDDPSPHHNSLVDSMPNHVYCRGLNSATVARDARLWFFYVTSNVLLLPQNWGRDGVITNNPANYLDVKNVAPGALGLTNPPFILSKDVVKPNVHYCLVTVVENPPFSDPPQAPVPIVFNSFSDLVSFINGTPNFAWLNTVEIPTPPNQQAYLVAPIANVPDGGELSIGVQLLNMPANDGSAISFSVDGPDKDNTIIFPKTLITNGNARYSQTVNWPGSFTGGNISIIYYPGSTTPPLTARISPSVWQPESMVRKVLKTDGLSSFHIEQKIQSLPLIPTYEFSNLPNVTYPRVQQVGSVNFKFKSV